MMHAIEDDLGDGAAAVGALASGFVIDSLGQAGEGSVAILCVGLEDETAGRTCPAD